MFIFKWTVTIFRSTQKLTRSTKIHKQRKGNSPISLFMNLTKKREKEKEGCLVASVIKCYIRNLAYSFYLSLDTRSISILWLYSIYLLGPFSMFVSGICLVGPCTHLGTFIGFQVVCLFLLRRWLTKRKRALLNHKEERLFIYQIDTAECWYMK